MGFTCLPFYLRRRNLEYCILCIEKQDQIHATYKYEMYMLYESNVRQNEGALMETQQEINTRHSQFDAV